MRNGKKVSASSLLTLIGVICFASVLVAAAALSSSILTNPRDVKATPLTLTLTSDTGGNDTWTNGVSDALIGINYDQGLNVSSSWTGSFKIKVIISGSTPFTSALQGNITYWQANVSTSSTVITLGLVGNNLEGTTSAAQSIVADDWSDYVFTVNFGSPKDQVVISFQAVTV